MTYLEDMLYQPEHFLFYATKMINQQDYYGFTVQRSISAINII